MTECAVLTYVFIRPILYLFLADALGTQSAIQLFAAVLRLIADHIGPGLMNGYCN